MNVVKRGSGADSDAEHSTAGAARAERRDAPVLCSVIVASKSVMKGMRIVIALSTFALLSSA
jgi:hypothetical protein